MSSLGVALGGAEALARYADDTLDFPTDGRRFSTRGGTHGTNRSGFLERELPEAPPAGVRRIVVLGDSMTWGTGSAAEAWPRVMEARLGAPWEAVNLSHYGYDAEQSLATLRAIGWRYGPDAVVFGTYGNDLVPTELITVGRSAMPAWVGGPDGPGTRWSLWRRVEGAWRTRGFEEREAPDRYRAALLALKEATATAGVPLFVVLLVPHVLAEPDLAACEARAGGAARCASALERAERQSRLLDSLSIPYLSTLPALRTGPERAWFAADSSDWEHPSPQGHVVVGEAVADWLGPMLPPAGAR